MSNLLHSLLLQAAPLPDASVFSSWDQVGIVGILMAMILLLLYLLNRANMAEQHAEQRADAYQAKYEALLKETIEDYKERATTVDLISRLALGEKKQHE